MKTLNRREFLKTLTGLAVLPLLTLVPKTKTPTYTFEEGESLDFDYSHSYLSDTDVWFLSDPVAHWFHNGRRKCVNPNCMCHTKGPWKWIRNEETAVLKNIDWTIDTSTVGSNT